MENDRSIFAHMPGGMFPVVAPGRQEVSAEWLLDEQRTHRREVPAAEIDAALSHLRSGKFSARAQYEGDGHVTIWS
jgi:hypothetical protein